MKQQAYPKDHLHHILDSDEKILWEGKSTLIPFLASGLPFLGFGLLWGLIDYGFIKSTLTSPTGIDFTFIPFFLLHLFPLWLGIGNMVRLVFVFNNIHYATTNKRVIIRSGFWGIDFKSIDYDKILDLRVTVNPIENMFNVGSIKMNSGMTTSRGATVYDSIASVPNPYEVFKHIKTTSVNIKTDWNYPNKIRPAENPGYKTAYKPEHS